MQTNVRDALAAQIAHDFYQALADNRPVDAAITDVRRLINGSSQSGGAELGIPV